MSPYSRPQSHELLFYSSIFLGFVGMGIALLVGCKKAADVESESDSLPAPVTLVWRVKRWCYRSWPNFRYVLWANSKASRISLRLCFMESQPLINKF